MRARDCSVVNMAFGNAVTLAWTLAKTNALKKEWMELRRMHNTDRPEFTQYNLFYYQAFQNAMAHHYGEAQSLLDKQLRLMPDDNSHVSYICVTLTNKAKLMAAKDNLLGAIQQLAKCRQYAYKYGQRDAALEVYRHLAEYEGRRGNVKEADTNRGHYLALKDSLLNLQQFSSIKEMSFMSSLRKVNAKMERRNLSEFIILLPESVTDLIANIDCVYQPE